MPKIEWKESYNIHIADLGIIRLVVSWEQDGWHPTVDGLVTYAVRQPFNTLEMAKAKAVQIAVKRLTEALNGLK